VFAFLCGTHFLISSRPPYKYATAALALTATLLISACVHRRIAQTFPPVTLSEPKTKRNLVVGQLLLERNDGELVAGPNLQTFGVVSHSVRLGSVSVSQADITLGEFLSVIGASSATCDAIFPSLKVVDSDVNWFTEEKDKVVGTEVSLLLGDVSNEVVEPKSLARLLKEERRRSADKVPWAPQGDSSGTDVRGAVAVNQAMYVGQAILRFRVSEKAYLPQTSTHFLGHAAKNVNEMILALARMTSACAKQAQARELPDPGLEVAVTFPARAPKGIRLVRFQDNRIVSLTPVETQILVYDLPRLPAWSLEKPRGGALAEPVWKVETTTARTFLRGAKDQPDEGSSFVKYCPEDGCYAVITGPREFDSKGRPYGSAANCVLAQPTFWSSLRDVFQREVKLRELVMFFGPAPTDSSTQADYSDYTSEVIRKALPSQVSVPRLGPTTDVWIYEYDCKGGVAQLHPHPRPLTGLTVVEHLRGWGLD
jgi:hypothetical protein